MRFFRKRSPSKRTAALAAAVHDASGGATFVVNEESQVRTARYERDGQPDFETYRRIQNEGNRLKIGFVYAKKRMIATIASHARKHLEVKSILCHGTRNGAELKWFGEEFPEAEILGTDIAESATQFPNTIQWDFHDFREDWRDRWNVIYSNSWDHAMEPERAFRAWADSLAPGGILYLEHGRAHDVSGTDGLDLFGATREALVEIVRDSTGLVPLGSIGKLHRTRRTLPFRKGAK